jgi:hypothetical protein
MFILVNSLPHTEISAYVFLEVRKEERKVGKKGI